MADENTDGTIRPEAFQRLQQDKADLKTQVAELEGAVRDTHFLNKAYEHFSGKEGVKDPYKVALQAVKDVTLKGVEGDELGPKLDGWLDGIQSIFGATPATDPPTEPPLPVADTAPVPGLARPNPAADGTPAAPGSQTIDTRSDEFQKLVASGDMAAIQKLDKDGLIAWKTKVPN